MEFAHLRYFVAVAEQERFTAAAASLGTAQSTVSWGVARLEEELGVVLLERTTRMVALTPHGRAFLPAARRVLAALDEGLEAISAEQR